MNPVRALLPALAALLLAALAGCGGGGGSPGTPGGSGVSGSTGSSTGGSSTPTPVVNKYVGTWVRCLATSSTGSTRETLALNRTSDTMMVFSDTQLTFNNLACTGTGAGQVTTTGTVQFVGATKAIGSDTVDEVNITQTGSTTVQKQVLVIHSDGRLFTGVAAGSSGAVLDANGYPSTLDPNGYSVQ